MPDWQAMGSELTKHQPVYTTRGAGAAPHPASASPPGDQTHVFCVSCTAGGFFTH